MKIMYAVRDLVARSLVGGIMVFTHDAPVIRIFADGLSDPLTTLNKHPKDFDLIALGEIADEGTDIEVSGYDKPRVVLTGAAWLAAQANGPEAVK